MPNASFAHLAAEDLGRLEAVCTSFEQAWRSWQEGPRPLLAAYLPPDGDCLRPVLLKELIRLDVDWRCRKGEAPAAADYVPHFSDCADWIDSCLAEAVGQVADLPAESLAGLPALDTPTQSYAAADAPKPPDVCQLEGLGRFHIKEKLGAGGFGCVYRAHDPLLERDVAIKVFHPDWYPPAANFTPFLEEARALARLKHPHIVPVYDAGQTEAGLCYLISDFIDGSNLAEVLKKSRPSCEQAVELVAAIADALHYVHLMGLCHRDIKPANILLDQKHQPYLADFGLALREEDFGTGAAFAGTIPYMSPEQARGEGHRVDGRSDIFGLGVVLYELLTGRRPFRADKAEELIEQIITVEPRPPRQIDDAIPREVERICLKALAKKATERYTTARDLAEDLRHWSVVRRPSSVAEAGQPARDNGPRTTDALAPLKIVPKGLRSFDAEDADFFLELLPGPRDRDGLPDSIRFWKSKIEEMDADKTFAVGLIYGPSGCGKSSLLKAGLLPRLAEHVVCVYVEATAEGTEARLLKGLRKLCADLPPRLGLVRALAALRKGQAIPPGKKILIVLDQFEQWLHARKGEANTDLVRAVRHADGGQVQCLVLVREDFWVAVSRFMAEIEVDIVQNRNVAMVDLFDPRHARKVLGEFGRAYGRLPEDPATCSPDQESFLAQSVSGLAQDQKIISVRLALFADMVKGKDWTPATLKDVGGIAGLGVTFLEETFSAAQHRGHAKAAQAVLKALLPELGTQIKGNMRSQQQLLEASGYAARPKDFDDLLRLLDADLRLITPTEPEDTDSRGDKQLACRPDQPTSKAACGYEKYEKYYQLTHDYLVPSLRDWLTRKQRETRRGRAEIRLAERAALWNSKPENRYLPAWWEWANMRLLTRQRDWSAPQRKLMRQAGRYHVLRGLMLMLLLAVLGWTGFEAYGTLTAHGLRDRLMNAATEAVPDIVADLGSYRRWVDPLLRDSLAEAEANNDARLKLHASLALLPVDPGQADFLYSRLLEAAPHEVPVLREALLPHKDELLEKLWQVVEQPPQGKEGQRLRAACALAKYDPENPRWAKVQEPVASDLVAVPAVYLGTWTDSLRAVNAKLLGPLAGIFRDPERRETERSLATDILADYAAGRPDILAELLTDADAKQFALIFAKLKRDDDVAQTALERELAKQAPTPSGQKGQTIPHLLKVQGTITEKDDKVRIADGKQAFALPAKVHEVKLQAGKKYAITMVSGELDAFLVVHDQAGKQLAFDDDGAGNLNARLDFTPPRDDVYKVYTASLKGTGGFTLAIVDGTSLEKLAKERERLAKEHQQATETLAKRQANAAVALLRLGQADKVWLLFQHSGDPRRRSYLIRQLPLLGAEPRELSGRLFVEPDVSSRRALLLALGEFGSDKLAAAERETLTSKVLELYRHDADPGIHGAADRLLRQWQQADKLKAIDQELTSSEVQLAEVLKKRRWYINGQGQTFSVMGPVPEFWMGSPPFEAGREGGPEGKMETRHKKRIGRTFAIANREVTVEQFLRFRKGHAYNKQYAPKPDCPAMVVTWYLAAGYCNWLSEKEGIAEDQRCYLKNAQGEYAEGMKAAPDYLKRTGYRLPTEAEWEYACRAGAVTSRYFGETEELLPRYAWYTKNSLNRWMLPAGSLLPNDLGLFDMLGNALEWCHDPTFYYPTLKGANAIEDVEYNEKQVLEKTPRGLRGGSFLNRPALVRSGNRDRVRPGNLYVGGGFRAARTFNH